MGRHYSRSTVQPGSSVTLLTGWVGIAGEAQTGCRGTLTEPDVTSTGSEVMQTASVVTLTAMLVPLTAMLVPLMPRR